MNRYDLIIFNVIFSMSYFGVYWNVLIISTLCYKYVTERNNKFGPNVYFRY